MKLRSVASACARSPAPLSVMTAVRPSAAIPARAKDLSQSVSYSLGAAVAAGGGAAAEFLKNVISQSEMPLT